jgi:hypothetical protein
MNTDGRSGKEYLFDWAPSRKDISRDSISLSRKPVACIINNINTSSEDDRTDSYGGQRRTCDHFRVAPIIRNGYCEPRMRKAPTSSSASHAGSLRSTDIALATPAGKVALSKT